MRSVYLNIIVASFAQAHGTVVANRSRESHDSVANAARTLVHRPLDRKQNIVNEMVSKLVDDMVDILFKRALKAWPLRPGPSNMTLGKPVHAAVSSENRVGQHGFTNSKRMSDLLRPIEPMSEGSAISAPQTTTPPVSTLPMARRKILEGGFAAAAVLVPGVAEASFGSSRGAVTSQPKLTIDVNVARFEALDPRKQAQVQSALQPSQVDDLLEELKAEKKALQKKIKVARKSGDRTPKMNDLLAKKLKVKEEVRKIRAELDEQESELKQAQERAGARINEKQYIMYMEEKKEALKREQQQEKLIQELERILQDEANIEEMLREQELVENAEQENTVKNALAEYKRKQELETRIAKRAAVLAGLGAQPDWFNYVAAFVASCVSTLVMHPVDTLKTRELAQAAEVPPTRPESVEDVDTTMQGLTVFTNTSKNVEPATGSLELGERQEGNVAASRAEGRGAQSWTLQNYVSLYQGIQGALLKEGPPSALYLGVYEAVKSQLLAKPSFADYPLLVYLIAGAAGESVGSVVRAPAEAIKSRVQTGTDPSTGESIRRVLFEDEGRSRVVKAWSASLWRDVPFGGIQLAIFEALKSFIINSPQSFLDIDTNSLFSEALFGAIGGAMGALLTVPMDVITTRILLQSCDEEVCEEELGFYGMTKKVLTEEGFPALVTGWQARTGYWAPAIGIFLSCYCGIRQAALQQSLFMN